MTATKTKPPYADCRVQIEDHVRATIDPMPEQAKARTVKRKTFGE